MKTILIDLDGTLVDAAPGIIRSCQIALAALGEKEPPASELRWIVGPPLRQSFARLLGGDERVQDALAHYRSFYSGQGIFEATPYEGVHDAIRALKAGDTRLFICTSKLRPFAQRVAGHFGLLPLFDGIYGAEPDGRFENKGDLIAHIRECEGFSPDRACMIGDRLHDIDAARRHGVKSVGALWGYGGRDELVAAGATVLCEQPAALPDIVAGLLP